MKNELEISIRSTNNGFIIQYDKVSKSEDYCYEGCDASVFQRILQDISDNVLSICCGRSKWLGGDAYGKVTVLIDFDGAGKVDPA